MLFGLVLLFLLLLLLFFFCIESFVTEKIFIMCNVLIRFSLTAKKKIIIINTLVPLKKMFSGLKREIRTLETIVNIDNCKITGSIVSF